MAAPPVEKLSYEQAREELVGVVARLEAGGETLEGSLALWERGEALAARCQQWLDGARARLDAVRAAEADRGPAAPGDADDEATDAVAGDVDDEATDAVAGDADDEATDAVGTGGEPPAPSNRRTGVDA